MKNIFLAFLILFSLNSFAQSSGISFDHSSWNQIVAKAKAEKKLIFMDAYASWCGPCKAMQQRVFPEKAVGEYFNANFINVKIDMEAGEGPAIAQKYPVRGYPTFFFIDPTSGKIVNQALGYRTSEQLIQIGQQTVDKKKSI